MPNRLRRYAVLAFMLYFCASCADDPVDVEYEHARRAGQEAGFAEGQARGFEAGFDEGKAKGFARGRREGRAAAALKWAPFGVGAGLLIGLLIAASLRREQVAAARAETARRARLQRAFKDLPAGLDASARAQLERILTLRQSLQTARTAQPGSTQRDLQALLDARLASVDTVVAELAAMSSRLRTALAATPTDLDSRLADRRIALAAAEDSALQTALHESVSALERSASARVNAENGLRRCTLQLEAVEAFLAHARLAIVNTDGDSTPHLTALATEIDDITAAAHTARAELAHI